MTVCWIVFYGLILLFACVGVWATVWFVWSLDFWKRVYEEA